MPVQASSIPDTFSSFLTCRGGSMLQQRVSITQYSIWICLYVKRSGIPEWEGAALNMSLRGTQFYHCMGFNQFFHREWTADVLAIVLTGQAPGWEMSYNSDKKT